MSTPAVPWVSRLGRGACVRLCAACALLSALAGCERAMRDMYDQPRYGPLQRAPSLPGGSASRGLPEDSVVRSKGVLASTSSGRIGAAEALEAARAERAQAMPYAITQDLLRRGHDRFVIYCAPCHSPAGDGDGLVARRGFPRPPSYHIERLRRVPDRHLYDVISDGHGIMYSYADRVAPPDRWAIVAYIRALQLSQNAPLAQLPADVRDELVKRSSPEGR